MKHLARHKIAELVFLCAFISCNGQKPFGTEHLKPERTIEMPRVSGRIDHIAINLKDNICFVAALGNNTVEAVDLNRGLVIHSIKGLDAPQGVCYIPDKNELVVANGGNGKCLFYNASNYEPVAAIDLKDDADNVRYDAMSKKIFVGYGNGGIAVIDADTHELVNDIKLPAHPESLQLDRKNNLLFVNLPDNNSIAVIDLNSFKLVSKWKTNDLKANFPMALDTAHNNVIIGYRHPSRLVSYDAISGKELGRTALVSDVDDVFFYEKGQEIIASGGGGSINIFKRESDGSSKIIGSIPTRPGTRTSLLVPSVQKLILAERATGNKPAALVVYTINDQ